MNALNEHAWKQTDTPKKASGGNRTGVPNGFTLIELMVAVGLFALVMTLAAGAYLMMINANRQAQALATGINNLSFGLETMTRDIRTGTGYCGGSNCAPGVFNFTNVDGQSVTYELVDNGTNCGGASAGYLARVTNGVTTPLTDPSVMISSLTFDTFGTAPYSVGNDTTQARVTIVVNGCVSAGPGKTQNFTIETGATMRGTDL